MEFKQLPPLAAWPRLLSQNTLRWQKPISEGLTLLLLVASAWTLGKMVWVVSAEQTPVPTWSPTLSGLRPNVSHSISAYCKKVSCLVCLLSRKKLRLWSNCGGGCSENALEPCAVWCGGE